MVKNKEVKLGTKSSMIMVLSLIAIGVIAFVFGPRSSITEKDKYKNLSEMSSKKAIQIEVNKEKEEK